MDSVPESEFGTDPDIVAGYAVRRCSDIGAVVCVDRITTGFLNSGGALGELAVSQEIGEFLGRFHRLSKEDPEIAAQAGSPAIQQSRLEVEYRHVSHPAAQASSEDAYEIGAKAEALGSWPDELFATTGVERSRIHAGPEITFAPSAGSLMRTSTVGWTLTQPWSKKPSP